MTCFLKLLNKFGRKAGRSLKISVGSQLNTLDNDQSLVRKVQDFLKTKYLGYSLTLLPGRKTYSVSIKQIQKSALLVNM